FGDLKVFSLVKDMKEVDVLQFFWQALVGGVAELLKNQPRNQLATLIPFRGDASAGQAPDILATVGNLLRNAFIRAYLPTLQRGALATRDMELEFEAPEITAPISPGEQP